MPQIIILGEVLPAHQCHVCGGLDTSAVLLARHERRHALTSAFLAGRVVMKAGHVFRNGKTRDKERLVGSCIACGNKAVQNKRRCCDCIAKLEAARYRTCLDCKKTKRIYAKGRCEKCYRSKFAMTKSKTMSSTGVEHRAGIKAA